MDGDVGGRRATLALDGLWDFEFEGPTARLDGEHHTTRPPGATRRGPDVIGAASNFPRSGPGKSIVLVMEGVFHEAAVLVDDVVVEFHGDGWTPIEIDLTSALAGKTAFVLGVDARIPDDRDGRFSQSLAAKQDLAQAGIWKSARLEARTQSTSPKPTSKHRLISTRALCR